MPLSPNMPAFPWLDLGLVLALVVLNGLFALSELAIVSARKPRLQAMVKAGKRGAQAALDLAAPARSGRLPPAVRPARCATCRARR